MTTSIVALVSCVVASGPSNEWLAQHDLVWDAAPTRWLEGIPLANGDIGALIWGDGHPLKITLDKYDAWETREVDAPATYDQIRQLVTDNKREEAEQILRTENVYGDQPYPTRLPMPRLELDLGESFDWASARLELESASATIQGREAAQSLRAWVDARHNRFVIEIDNGFTKPNVRIRWDHLDSGARDLLARWGYPEPTMTGDDRSGTFHLEAPTGYEVAVAWERHPRPGGESIVVAIVSSLDHEDPLSAASEICQSVPESSHRDVHEAWWRAYWDRSWLTIPDARLEALYYAEMYKLGCLSRPGKMPITLQGLWTLDGGMPPWSGDYHLDMNVQQSYWPIYTANRLELGEPLYRTFTECLPRWRKQSVAFYGHDGIWTGCAIGPRGERVFGYSGVELWPGNGAWLAHHYWLHYLYSQDKSFLEQQALPFLELALKTYDGLLEEGPDGRLHVPLSYSPEYGEGGFDAYCADPNIDLMLIQFLAQAIQQGYADLGKESDVAKRAAEVSAKLVDYQAQDGELLVSAGTRLEHSHRHHSHLIGLYPLDVLDPAASESSRALIERSMFQIRRLGTGEWTGWAFPWMSMIAGRAGHNNMAWQMLDTYANSFIYPNTFHINGDPRKFGLSLFTYEPMTLEAGFGAAAAVMEMLVQSHGGLIRLFPTIPDRWHSAYFADLRCEGAFVVTAKLEADEVVFVQVHSDVGQKCRIENPFNGQQAAVVTGDDAQILELSGGVLEFPTVAGGDYLLFPADRRPSAEDMSPPQFERFERDRNFYGKKKAPRF